MVIGTETDLTNMWELIRVIISQHQAPDPFGIRNWQAGTEAWSHQMSREQWLVITCHISQDDMSSNTRLLH